MMWSSGILPYDRILNYLYFVFLTGWFFICIALTYQINRKFKIRFEKLPKYLYAAAFIFILICLIRENNITIAYSDLFRGDAYNYNNEMNGRYNYILQNTADTLEIDSIRNVPRSFFFLDITSSPEAVYNLGFTPYFNKKSILMKKSGSTMKQ